MHEPCNTLGGTPARTGTADLVSALLSEKREGGKHPPFRTPVEILAALPAEVPWAAKPWLAAGCITELAGKVKLAGKTTFLSAMLAAIRAGSDFIGEPTTRTNAVWLSEQPEQSLREALIRARLHQETGLAIRFYHEVRGLDWPRIVELAVVECRRRSAGILVVDTLGQFAGLRGDSENFAGEALAAVEPLQLAAAGGLAVLVTRHERKGGGEVGDSARGSSAFTGAVDIVMALRRPEGAHRPNVRVIHTVSRFDGAPAELYVEFDGSSYRSLGSGHDVAQRDVRQGILRILGQAAGKALRLDAIRTHLPGSRRTVIQRALEALAAEGLVARGGKGRKGDAFTYFLSAPTEALVADSTCRGSRTQEGRFAAHVDGSSDDEEGADD